MRVHLFAPSDPAKLDNAFASGADALWLDGSVAVNAGQSARQRAAHLKLYVCLGNLDDDLDAAMNAAPDGIVVPVRYGADVQHLGVKLAVHEAELGLADGATRILARVAAPATIFQMGSFVGASPRLAGLAFDAGHFAAGIGASDTQSRPVALARTLSLLAAKAAGVPALVIADETEGLIATYQAAKRDGFDTIVTRGITDVAILRGL